MLRRYGLISVLIMLGFHLLWPTNTYALQTLNRLAGQDRYETAKVIAEYSYSDKVDNVILATGNSFADAISASVFAHKIKAPILLINSTVSTSGAALDFIPKHMDTNGKVYIIGGTSVQVQDFTTTFHQMGYENIEQLSGKDIYQTNAIVTQKCNVEIGTPVVLASGEDFPDALGISSIAASKGWPILLVQKNSIPESIKDYLANLKPSEIFIVGGSSVIQTSIETELSSLVLNTTIHRIAGETRFDTSAHVLQTFAPNPHTLYLATGDTFPDALAGSVLASKTGDPLVLIDSSKQTLPPAIAVYLKSLVGSGVAITALGGTSVISDQLVSNVSKIINGSVDIRDIYSIDDLTIDVTAGDIVSLPTMIRALLYDSTSVDLPVTWEQTTISTSVPGPYSLKGSVNGFSNEVLLKGTIMPKKETYEGLKNALVKKLGSNLTKVGISFCDLTSDTTFSLNGDQKFLAASTAKLPIVMVLYDLINEGRLTENQLVTYENWEYQGGTGVLQYRNLSKPISYNTLAEYAIRHSDNIAIAMIQHNLCERSELDERLKTLIGHNLLESSDNFLSAKSSMTVLKTLYTGANEGNIGYQKIVEWLKTTDFHDRLDRNLDHSLVAHKIGNLNGATNDIGLFYTNKPYILTVYTSYLVNPNATITSISDFVYEYQAKHAGDITQ